jgi:tubby-related protein 1
VPLRPGESASDGGMSQLAPRTELGAVTYEYNVLGTRGPRKMTTVIPSVDGNGQRSVFRPVNKVCGGGRLDRVVRGC